MSDRSNGQRNGSPEHLFISARCDRAREEPQRCAPASASSLIPLNKGPRNYGGDAFARPCDTGAFGLERSSPQQSKNFTPRGNTMQSEQNLEAALENIITPSKMTPESTVKGPMQKRLEKKINNTTGVWRRR